MISSEYLTLEEASEITGFKISYLRDLAKKAGMTRIGRNALMKSEFNAYFTYRSQEADRPKRIGENRIMRMHRVNREWRKLLIDELQDI